MSIKRRGFLAMFGAAVSAPALPMAAPSRDLMQVAVAHARKYPVISVGGLSKRGAMTVPQAEAMIRKLAHEGMVKLVGPSPSGSARAASKIMVGDPWGLARTAQERQTAALRRDHAAQSRRVARATAKSVPPWIAHLRGICRAEGMTLHQRCFA